MKAIETRAKALAVKRDTSAFTSITYLRDDTSELKGFQIIMDGLQANLYREPGELESDLADRAERWLKRQCAATGSNCGLLVGIYGFGESAL